MSDPITFGTDGWRAIIADQFTFANVERVAYAIGSYVRRRYYNGASSGQVPVLIGYDTRFLAEKFAEKVACVLLDMGVPAQIASRDVPTPAIAWSVQLAPTAGAVQLTASHNPPEYCGIKYIPHFAGPATNEITTEIAAYLNDMPLGYEAGAHHVPVFEPMPPYLEALESRVDLKRIGSSGLRVAYDAMYSTSRGYLDRVLKDAGVECAVLHDWRDPLFGGGMPEPKERYLKELMQVVRDNRYDVGLATDGDADRFAVIDEKGGYLAPNQLLALLTRHLVKNRKQKGALVRTVATSHLIDCLARAYDLELIETPVGFKYIGEVMRSKDVLIGGEESGGVSIQGHIPEKDGILANLLLVEMIACEGKPLSRIWLELEAEVGVRFFNRRADLILDQDRRKELMQVLKQHPPERVGGEQVSRVGDDDGLKFYVDELNWFLVRPSGTEPLLRLYFEATAEERVERLAADFGQQVETILGSLNGPAKPATLPQAEART